MKPKGLVVIGYAGHGKDTVCEYLQSRYGLNFMSSSEYACRLFIFDKLKDSHGYSSVEECHADRVNHRSLWYDMITEFNTPNKARLGTALFSEYSVYCGLRNRDELNALKAAGLVDMVWWISAGDRVPKEPPNSITVSVHDATHGIDNSGALDNTYRNIDYHVQNAYPELYEQRTK